MGKFSDLPDAPIVNILSCARPARYLPGTNKYARVCWRWLQISDNSFVEEDGLQLFMDLSRMSAKDRAHAAGWMAMHGRTVATLAVKASMQQVGWYRGSAPALTRIRRLELDQAHSLYNVAPVLRRMPHLEHLAAGISLAVDPNQPLADPACGRFVHDNLRPKQPGWQVPDLQQLCPSLIHLRLTCDKTCGTLMMDPQLPRLLPARLQQLSLGAAPGVENLWMKSSSLVHLSALQQLSLQDILVAEEGPGSVVQNLRALHQLQQVRLSHTDDWVLDMNDTLQLAPRVTSLGVFAWLQGAVEVLPRLVHLTQLALSVRGKAGMAGVPGGMAAALAALAGLQELTLGCTMDASLVPVMEQVAAMPTLRSLQLEQYSGKTPSLGAHLGQCMQLTSLVIKGVSTGASRTCVAALQQLTGLRCLTVPAEVLEHQAGDWLVPLTALTRLGVRPSSEWMEGQPKVLSPQGMAQQLLQRVRACRVQQVVVTFAQGYGDTELTPKSFESSPAGVGGVQLSVWIEEEGSVAAGWVRPFRPCPHLPGVWELQGEAE
jgi:hypothetical protein